MNLAVLTTGGATKGTLQAGRRTTGFIEREKCLFVVPPGFSGALLVDEIALELDAERAHWEWEPRFFAGTAVAELRDVGGGKLAEYVIDVSPDPNKLGRDLFEEMVTSLQNANPILLLGTEPSSVKIGASGGGATLNTEYLRLKFYSQAYLDSLREISEHPIYR